MKDIPYVTALTEGDLTPDPKWYPRMKRKEKLLLIESKANDRTSFADQVCGTLNPIVYALNKGKSISPKSAEHKMLIELLTKANIT